MSYAEDLRFAAWRKANPQPTRVALTEEEAQAIVSEACALLKDDRGYRACVQAELFPEERLPFLLRRELNRRDREWVNDNCPRGGADRLALWGKLHFRASYRSYFGVDIS